MQSVVTFGETMTTHFKLFAWEIAWVKSAITKEWTNSYFPENVFSPSVFQGYDAFKQCAREISQVWWKPILEKFMRTLRELALESLSFLESEIKKLRHWSLATKFYKWVWEEWTAKCDTLIADFECECMIVLNDESKFGTVNHYLDANYKEQEVMPEELIMEIMK